MLINFQVNADTKSVILQLSCQSPKKDNYVPCLVWYKGGLVFSTPSKVQFWRRKSPEGWALIWTYETKTPFAKLLSSSLRDHLLGVTIWVGLFFYKFFTQLETIIEMLLHVLQFFLYRMTWCSSRERRRLTAFSSESMPVTLSLSISFIQSVTIS